MDVPARARTLRAGGRSARARVCSPETFIEHDISQETEYAVKKGVVLTYAKSGRAAAAYDK